jgi:hypothetical protein
MITKSKIDNNAIKMRWARLPTFEKRYQEATNDALVSFVDFIPPTVFEKVKPFWQGYVEYNGKKTAIYKIEIVEFLLTQTYNIELDGSIYIKSVKDYPGSVVLNKLLNLCKESDVPEILKMAKKQRSRLIFSQIKQDLWGLFNPAEVVPIMKNKAASFEWIDVKATHNEKQYSFDLTNGFLYYEEVRWFNNERTTIARFASLKNKEENVKLFKLVVEYKKYGKIINELMNEDFESRWTNGYDEKTYAPKGKRINFTEKEEDKLKKKEQKEQEMQYAVFEINVDEEVEREREARAINQNFSTFLKKNMMERKEEIEESFQSIEIITDGEPKYLDELKTLDLEDLGDLDDFLNS